MNPQSLRLLQQQIEYTFRDEALLRLALTHPSVAHETSASTPHNQRLEFLGDAVLGLVLTRELYDKFPHLGEGPLTKARAQMVNRRTLTTEARRINLGDFLFISRGEEATGGRERASALADALEALFGAVFLDGGLEAARALILRHFSAILSVGMDAPSLVNPKGELQETFQASSAAAPTYEQILATGPDHERVFECAVHHDGVELGRGRGRSKKEAESEAALAALLKLRAAPSESAPPLPPVAGG